MILRVVKWVLVIAAVLVAVCFAYSQYLVFSFNTEALPDNHGEMNTQLFLSNNVKQPLIVGLGGAEGGMHGLAITGQISENVFYLKAMVF